MSFMKTSTWKWLKADIMLKILRFPFVLVSTCLYCSVQYRLQGCTFISAKNAKCCHFIIVFVDFCRNFRCSVALHLFNRGAWSISFFFKFLFRNILKIENLHIFFQIITNDLLNCFRLIIRFQGVRSERDRDTASFNSTYTLKNKTNSVIIKI